MSVQPEDFHRQNAGEYVARHGTAEDVMEYLTGHLAELSAHNPFKQLVDLCRNIQDHQVTDEVLDVLDQQFRGKHFIRMCVNPQLSASTYHRLLKRIKQRHADKDLPAGHLELHDAYRTLAYHREAPTDWMVEEVQERLYNTTGQQRAEVAQNILRFDHPPRPFLEELTRLALNSRSVQLSPLLIDHAHVRAEHIDLLVRLAEEKSHGTVRTALANYQDLRTHPGIRSVLMGSGARTVLRQLLEEASPEQFPELLDRYADKKQTSPRDVFHRISQADPAQAARLSQKQVRKFLSPFLTGQNTSIDRERVLRTLARAGANYEPASRPVQTV